MNPTQGDDSRVGRDSARAEENGLVVEAVPHNPDAVFKPAQWETEQ